MRFCGEVERVMNRVVGCGCWWMPEGPCANPVLLKLAMAMGHSAIVVINKVDRKGRRPGARPQPDLRSFFELSNR
jgi:predicted membrane GTPase involved in stress response